MKVNLAEMTLRAWVYGGVVGAHPLDAWGSKYAVQVCGEAGVLRPWKMLS